MHTHIPSRLPHNFKCIQIWDFLLCFIKVACICSSNAAFHVESSVAFLPLICYIMYYVKIHTPKYYLLQHANEDCINSIMGLQHNVFTLQDRKTRLFWSSLSDFCWSLHWMFLHLSQWATLKTNSVIRLTSCLILNKKKNVDKIKAMFKQTSNLGHYYD